ncbi:EAL domain-containing protein [Klebsiella pneumoniae]|nr:EAL domain-containing protein [Klebsiella pneumoniae]
MEIPRCWNNPDVGRFRRRYLSPSPKAHLIIPLTRYVIAETARRLDAFPRDRHFHIAINVAARHFANGPAARPAQLPVQRDPVQQLVVELTERDVLQDYTSMAEHLHFKGVQLAIDDFGTGNTSPFMAGKLPGCGRSDRSFTSSVGIDSA